MIETISTTVTTGMIRGMVILVSFTQRPAPSIDAAATVDAAPVDAAPTPVDAAPPIDAKPRSHSRGSGAGTGSGTSSINEIKVP